MNYATFPIASVDLSNTPAPKIEDFNRGGEHYGMLRNLIKCRAPNGEHITWGSDDRVTLTSRELEDLVPRIALHGAQMFLDQMKEAAQSAESHETWPSWMANPGALPLPRGWELYLEGGVYHSKMKCRDRSPEDDLSTTCAEHAKYMTWIKAQLVWTKHLLKQKRLARPDVQEVKKKLYECLLTYFNRSGHENIQAEVLTYAQEKLGVVLSDKFRTDFNSSCVFLSTYDFSPEVSDDQLVKYREDSAAIYADSFIGKIVDMMD